MMKDGVSCLLEEEKLALWGGGGSMRSSKAWQAARRAGLGGKSKEVSTFMEVLLEESSDGGWELETVVLSASLRSFTLPLR
jgi:hypothetical protein